MNQNFLITHQKILNLTTADNLLAAVFYVAYRSQNPDNETVTCVLEQLQKNDIDVNQLAVWPDKHC